MGTVPSKVSMSFLCLGAMALVFDSFGKGKI